MRRRTRLAVSLMSFPIAWSGGCATVSAPKAAKHVVEPTDAGGPAHNPDDVGSTTTTPEPEAPLVTLPPGLGPTTTEPVEQSGGIPFPASSPSRTPAAGPASSTSENSGLASWYGSESGSTTANGEHFDPDGFTTAHLTLPFGTRLRVCHEEACVLVRVTDRGPAAWTGRQLDLSRGAFAALAPLSSGVIAVTWAVA